MASILIIGSTGMLGSAVTKYLSKSTNKIIESNTSGKSIVLTNTCIKFDIEKQKIPDLFPFDFGEPDFVINCSGLIKHKIDETSPELIERAYKVNSYFPNELSEFCNSLDTKIIQIATDCVFTGSTGGYAENSNHDAKDVYGDSKSKGEIAAKNMMVLRCSVIGREYNSHVELMDWILNHPVGSKISGFTNHYWNGLTTLHFARIVSGIIESEIFESGTHHVLPVDSVSKFELIELICEGFGRQDIEIKATEAGSFVDRRLSTKYPEKNIEFWQYAGYDKPLSIREMIAEYSNWIRAE